MIFICGSDTFGPDEAQYLFIQYPFTDIYGNRRLLDFAFESARFCWELITAANMKEKFMEMVRTMDMSS
ncbi:hypothetical protein JT05_14085 [Desulfosporosinus sp. Tol-M]|nr:hypothetical protein JT05_14085 [Desulfosporosinus sp. Tol-M]